MQPLSMSIQGFKSFGAERTLEFPSGAGFFLLRGKNLVNPDLGANGTGKSSIWDALCWILYDKTLRGVKGPSLKSRFSPGFTMGKFRFEREGHTYEIRRTLDPKSLMLTRDTEEAHTITNEEVIDLVGISFQAFSSAIVIGQFSQLFFDIGATDKLTLFTELLQLDRWVKASESAKEKTKSVDQTIAQLNSQLSSATGSLEATKKQLEQVRRNSEDFESAKTINISRSKQQVEARQHHVTLTEEDLKRVEAQLATLAESAVAHEEKFSKLTETKQEEQKKLLQIENELRRISNDISTIETRIVRIERLGDVCPTCDQTIRSASKTHAVEDCKKEVAWWQNRQEEEEQKQERQKKRLEEVMTSVRSQEQTISNLLKEIDELEIRRAVLLNEKRNAASQLQYAQELLRKHQQEVNQWTEMLSQMELTVAELNSRIETCNAQKLLREQEKTRFEYWVRGFKDLRLWLIDSALVELEIEVNNSIIELGLRGWSISFDVEKELSDGKISRGFVVNIQPPDSDQPVPWNSWSGGETQRLRIAGAAGLAKVITKRQGISWPFEVWDEPTAHLSEQGIDQLMDFLKQRSVIEKKQIWLIDHRSIDFGGFDHQYVVEKTQEGSRIVRIS